MTATQLRKNLYRVIDGVVRTGLPAEITCRGQVVLLVAQTGSSRLARMKKRPILKCVPDGLADVSWEGEWKPYI